MSEGLTKTFTIEIGEGPGGCICNLISYRDKKGVCLTAPSLRMLMHKIVDYIRKRQSHLKRFPLPTDGLIVTLDMGNGNHPPQAVSSIWMPK